MNDTPQIRTPRQGLICKRCQREGRVQPLNCQVNPRTIRGDTILMLGCPTHGAITNDWVHAYLFDDRPQTWDFGSSRSSKLGKRPPRPPGRR